MHVDKKFNFLSFPLTPFLLWNSSVQVLGTYFRSVQGPPFFLRLHVNSRVTMFSYRDTRQGKGPYCSGFTLVSTGDARRLAQAPDLHPRRRLHPPLLLCCSVFSHLQGCSTAPAALRTLEHSSYLPASPRSLWFLCCSHSKRPQTVLSGCSSQLSLLWSPAYLPGFPERVFFFI